MYIYFGIEFYNCTIPIQEKLRVKYLYEPFSNLSNRAVKDNLKDSGLIHFTNFMIDYSNSPQSIKENYDTG